ncbi:MAG: KTSC domain-containing protein [Acidimicrobiia bacterium]|nr:KTSC domain-containing protein [Acidimicrobiia bacterium]MCY4458113.1 KTSC domain-containing protein [Acidimicrobiaceae bacterium]
MNRKSVESSNIASAGYDDQTNTLEIEFQRGGIYQYFDVPRPIYDQLVDAGSPGSVLHQQIRGIFRYARI